MTDSPKPVPSVYDHLGIILQQLVEVAWQKLGIQPDMVTGRIEANFPEAKVAIDLASHISGLVEPQLDADDRRQLQNVMRDLRVNYVQRVGA
jgi:hypothetical protein